MKLAPGLYEHPRMSPDGRLVTFATDDGKEGIVWVYDLAGTSAVRRLTFGGRNRFPIWSADSQRVAFQSDREGDLGIFWQRADGNAQAERLTKPDQGTSHVPESWSPKGDRFLFNVVTGSTSALWTFSLQEKKATPFGGVESSHSTHAVFSPDGQWVAYSSRDTRNIVFVQPFPATGAKYQISKNNEDGHHPLWSPNGTELFYVPGPGQFVVVGVTTTPSFTFSNPAPVPRQFGIASGTSQRTYDITPDGRRFLAVTTSDPGQTGAASPPIHVVLNWFEELKARVGAK